MVGHRGRLGVAPHATLQSDATLGEKALLINTDVLPTVCKDTKD